MIELIIIIVLMIICGVTGTVAMLGFPEIMNKIKAKRLVKRGFGMVCLIGNNYKMKKKWVKLDEFVNIEGHLYTIKPKFVTWNGRIPTYFFYEGDSRPIDMLKRRLDEKINPELMSIAMIKSKMAGSISKPEDNKMMFFLTLGACALAGISVALIFNMSVQLQDMQVIINSLRSAITP